MIRKKKYRILSFNASGVIIPHTLVDLQQTLSLMGHRVYVVDVPEIKDARSREIAIMDALIEADPHFIVTIDNVGLIPSQYLTLKPDLKIISWFFDSPKQFIFDNVTQFNSRYYHFCWDRAYENMVRDMGVDRFYHMPFGTNPEVYKHIDCEKKYDVSFVGTWSKNRQKVLAELADKGIVIDLFGNDKWERLAHPNINFHGFADNRNECPLIYNQSKINLNVTSEQLLTSLPVRIFDVGVCKAFLLTDEQKDAKEMFTSEELVIYNDIDDLAEKIRYYLEHDKERENIAMNMASKVSKEFTFDVLLNRIFETVLDDESQPENTPLDGEEKAIALWKTALSYIHATKYNEAISLLNNAISQKIKTQQLHVALLIALLYSLSKTNNIKVVENILSLNPELKDMFSHIMSIDQQGLLRNKLYGFNNESGFTENGTVLQGNIERVFA